MKRALVAMTLMSLTACGSVHPVASTASTEATPRSFVPWLPLAPAHQFVDAPPATPVPPIPIPAGTAPCKADQLEGAALGAGAAAGNVDMPLAFRNRGSSDCWLEGYLGITMLDREGRVLASATGPQNLGTFFADGPVTQILLLAGTPRLVPQAGAMSANHGAYGQAWMNMSWYDCTSPRASRAVVDLPSGGRFSMPFTFAGDANPACYPGSTARPAIDRGPISPGGMAWPPQPAYLQDTVALAAPAPARAGSTVSLFVTIANTGAKAYDMLPCADYSAGLQAKHLLDQRQLNCSPVKAIAPAGSATFEIRVEIPPATAAGTYELWWSLADGRLEMTAATATITIT